MRAQRIVEALLETKTIAVDLDGTLAKHTPGKFDRNKIGDPVPAMLKKVKAALSAGNKVVIFTARAADEKNVAPIRQWLKDNGLEGLKVTNEKTPDIAEIWDDRAKGVKLNSGTFKS